MQRARAGSRATCGRSSASRGRGDPRGRARDDAFSAWRRFFEALAERRPLALVFEDLHWADDALLDFVDQLVDWVSGVPLLVLAHRAAGAARATAGLGRREAERDHASRSRRSSEDETARLLASLLDQPVMPADRRRALSARAGATRVRRNTPGC